MPSYHSCLQHAAKTLASAGVASPRLDARLLLAYVCDVSSEKILGYPQTELTQPQQEQFSQLITRRANREPLSHLIGKREFWGMDFTVTADTLDPRPDSETLIEAVIEQFSNRKEPLNILDLGTGTGCLLLSLLATYPHAKGVGVDVSASALEVAKTNAKHLALAKRTRFMLNDWCEGLEETYDIIVSNPPYITSSDVKTLEPEVAHYEPYLALVGGEDGLSCYRKIIPQLPPLLSSKGYAFLEFGQGQEHQVMNIALEAGLTYVSFKKDLATITRCIVLQKN